MHKLYNTHHEILRPIPTTVYTVYPVLGVTVYVKNKSAL